MIKRKRSDYVGSGYIVECQNCHFQKDFFLGVGMGFGYWNYDNVLKKVHHKKRESLLKQIGYKSVIDFHFRHTLYHCESCYTLKEKSYLKVLLNTDEEIETTYSCPSCKKQMQELMNPTFEKIHCPKCHKKKLKQNGIILWD